MDMTDRYEVIKEIPIGRFLYRFDNFPAISVGTILESDGKYIVYDNGFICDINSKLEKRHLRKCL